MYWFAQALCENQSGGLRASFSAKGFSDLETLIQFWSPDFKTLDARHSCSLVLHVSLDSRCFVFSPIKKKILSFFQYKKKTFLFLISKVIY